MPDSEKLREDAEGYIQQYRNRIVCGDEILEDIVVFALARDREEREHDGLSEMLMELQKKHHNIHLSGTSSIGWYITIKDKQYLSDDLDACERLLGFIDPPTAVKMAARAAREEKKNVG